MFAASSPVVPGVTPPPGEGRFDEALFMMDLPRRHANSLSGSRLAPVSWARQIPATVTLIGGATDIHTLATGSGRFPGAGAATVRASTVRAPSKPNAKSAQQPPIRRRGGTLGGYPGPLSGRVISTELRLEIPSETGNGQFV